MKSKSRFSGFVIVAMVLSVSAVFFYLGRRSAFLSSEKPQTAASPEVRPAASAAIQKFTVPSFDDIPKDELGESIRRGKSYLENTYSQLPRYVGAKMNCVSCHTNSGTTQLAGPWVAITARFPQYRSRSGQVDTLEDRINDCFERSMNGKRLPEAGSEMTDMVSYMTWLSKGYVIGEDVEGSGMPQLKLDREPNLANGKVVYANKCASCHMQNGEGVFEGKRVVFPALWGPDSFNIGAGMARLHTAAGFVKENMPLDEGNSLTDDEAWDVAAYFSKQPRPDFPNKRNDWKQGSKPTDARY